MNRDLKAIMAIADAISKDHGEAPYQAGEVEKLADAIKIIAMHIKMNNPEGEQEKQ